MDGWLSLFTTVTFHRRVSALDTGFALSPLTDKWLIDMLICLHITVSSLNFFQLVASVDCNWQQIEAQTLDLGWFSAKSDGPS